jgi:hypothetical protein
LPIIISEYRKIPLYDLPDGLELVATPTEPMNKEQIDIIKNRLLDLPRITEGDHDYVDICHKVFWKVKRRHPPSLKRKKRSVYVSKPLVSLLVLRANLNLRSPPPNRRK